MIQIDEKFKDAAPEETLAKIEKILSDNGISIDETKLETGLKNCHSYFLKISGTNAFSNGKGVTPILARASAYAEMMERLQSGRLGTGATVFPDSFEVTNEELIANCKDYLDAIAKAHPKDDGTVLTTEEMANLAKIMNRKSNTVVVPYYDITDDKMTYFPQELTRIYSTTGLAAGNSPEEAMVQGISEILERNALLKIMKDNIVPPNIPDEVLQQYPHTYETITEVRNAGYEVQIKDCSLERPFPVLAAILIDKRTHRYHVHFGCHPLFEIALRRTLTETFQGRTIKNVTAVNGIAPAKAHRHTDKNIMRNMVNYTGTYPAEFFGNEFSYQFKPFKDRSSMSNMDMLKEIVEFFNTNGYKMLVRDHSCLGFNTFRIIVPGFSEVNEHYITSGTEYYNILNSLDAYSEPFAKISKEAAKKRLYIENYTAGVAMKSTFTGRFAAPLAMDAKANTLLYYLNMAHLEWAAGNTANASKYLSAATALIPAFDSDYLSCLNNWIRFMEYGCSEDEILENLAPFYFERTIAETHAAIKANMPFAKYAHCCDDIDCQDCQYRPICLDEACRKVKNLTNTALGEFDNEAAFERLKTLFSKIR